LAQHPLQSPPPNDGKLRIIVFGAHPDDAEYRGAGVAMKWGETRPPREARVGDKMVTSVTGNRREARSRCAERKK
jgi:LmbE family N-acetylglucosaminyl deacetylase